MFSPQRLSAKIFLPLFVLCLLLPVSAGALELPSIFGNGMVLQRDKPVVVWGWAEAGEKVEVEFGGKFAVASAGDNGLWEARLPSMPASGEGKSLVVRGGGETHEFKDVVVGDVWILGGQSNMGWDVNQSDGAHEAKARAAYPWLRGFFQWPYQGASETAQRDVTGGQWQKCSAATAGRFSAVGFFFAEALHPHAAVPIGLVHTAMGGTAIETWLAPETAATLPAAQVGGAWFRQQVAKYLANKPAWDAAFAEWQRAAEAARAAGQPEPPRPPLIQRDPEGLKPMNLPSALYNGKVHPLQPFAARGIVWYQGEGNASDAAAAERYGDLLEALVADWRRGWRDPEMPFIVVQLPGYVNPKNPSMDWPGVRARQAEVAARTAGVHLVVTIDLGARDDIHPKRKQPVGERVALVVRREVIGEKDVVAQGPRLVSAKRDDGMLRLRFATTGGLVSDEGSPGSAWELAGADGVFVAVEGKIDGDDVLLPIPEGVGGPFRIRYAWRNWPEGIVRDASSRLPVAPFQTDGF